MKTFEELVIELDAFLPSSWTWRVGRHSFEVKQYYASASGPSVPNQPSGFGNKGNTPVEAIAKLLDFMRQAMPNPLPGSLVPPYFKEVPHDPLAGLVEKKEIK